MDILKFISDEWDNFPYPAFPCPRVLFIAIFQASCYRSRDSGIPFSGVFAPIPTPEDIIASANKFSPEDWVPPNVALQDELLLLARIYHCSTMLYCTSVLRPHLLEGLGSRIDQLLEEHKTLLPQLLEKSQYSRRVIRACVWPLIVAGVVVAQHDAATQALVGKELVGLSGDLAAPALLEARVVLETFWDSDKNGWEACFDQPYAFVQ